MTAFYMFRLVFLTFWGESRMDKETEAHVHESPKSMTVPLMILCFLAVVGGWVGIPHAITAITHFPAANHFEEWLHPVVEWSEAELAGGHMAAAHHGEEAHAAADHGHHAVDPVEYVLMVVSVGLALAGIFLAAAWYRRKTATPEKLAGVMGGGPHRMLLNKYWVDELYDMTVVQRFIWFGNFLWKFIDVIIIDGTVNAVAHISRFFGIVGSRFQTGYVRNYALGIILGVVILIWACLR
jgi:NADH-quinone oxidoreductase subunit L